MQGFLSCDPSLELTSNALLQFACKINFPLIRFSSAGTDCKNHLNNMSHDPFHSLSGQGCQNYPCQLRSHQILSLLLTKWATSSSSISKQSLTVLLRARKTLSTDLTEQMQKQMEAA